MDSAKTAAGNASPAVDPRAARYLAGVGRHLLRVLVVLFVVPLIMLKAAHSFSKSEVATTSAEPASAALKTTLAGSGVIVGAGAWDANTLAILGGLLIAALGFLLQVWLGWRKDRREAREHEAKMREHAARMSELSE